jgi:sugar phosphate isomerase/epimerase
MIMTHHNPTPFLPLLAVEPLGLDLRGAAQAAENAGYGGIAVGIGHPELNPGIFGRTAQRHFRKLLSTHGLVLGALRVGAGKAGVFESSTSQRLLDAAISACDLAHSMQTPLISVYIGEPVDTENISSDVMEIFRILAAQTDRAGIVAALSCGQTQWLRKLLGGINAPSLAASLDSVRILAGGASPPDAAAALAGQIAVWTCADAIRSGSGTHTTLLGQGRAAGDTVARILKDQDFKGPTIMDVRDLQDPLYAAEHARTTLKNWVLP